ncbi:MAG: response regulator [Anaerolineae bacterium]|jgi:CheY-like chemotaxis protein
METIVVADDDRVFRQLLATVFDLEGYRAVVVTTPEDVVPTVRREAPAVVLMDIHFRSQDTLGALRELKGDQALSEIPVIMTSGMDRADECLAAGADAFLLKPFRPSEMLAKIRDLA